MKKISSLHCNLQKLFILKGIDPHALAVASKVPVKIIHDACSGKAIPGHRWRDLSRTLSERYQADLASLKPPRFR